MSPPIDDRRRSSPRGLNLSLAGVANRPKRKPARREPAALVDDAGLTAWLFRLGRLLRLFGLVGLLDLAHHVAELQAKVMGDDAPTLVDLALRDDLVERRLLTEALVPLHQLLR